MGVNSTPAARLARQCEELCAARSRDVPCITTMSGARAAAAAIAARVRDPIRVWSLQEIHAKTVA